MLALGADFSHFDRQRMTSQANRPAPSGVTIQSPTGVRSVGLFVAGPTERHQPVEVEVRAPLRPLQYVMHVEAGPGPACLARPVRPRQDPNPDQVPLGDAGRRSPDRPRTAGATQPPRGPTHRGVPARPAQKTPRTPRVTRLKPVGGSAERGCPTAVSNRQPAPSPLGGGSGRGFSSTPLLGHLSLAGAGRTGSRRPARPP
jgi:hypothetical protein